MSIACIWFKLTRVGQLVEWLRVRLWSGGSEVQISGLSNRTQSYQRLATAKILFGKKLCLPRHNDAELGPANSYTLRRNKVSIIKDLIWFKTVLEIQSLLLRCRWTNLPNSKPIKSFILRMYSFILCCSSLLLCQWLNPSMNFIALF